MPANLDSASVFKIVTCATSEGTRPVGINLTAPAFENVRLDEPIQTWQARHVGNDLYRFSIGEYPFTGVEGDSVIVSIHPEQEIEWHATYKANFNAYTIEPAEDRSKGWTVSEYSTNPYIVVKDIKYDDTDLKYQLFCFKPISN